MDDPEYHRPALKKLFPLPIWFYFSFSLSPNVYPIGFVFLLPLS
jgi:hypothetical protein